MCLCQNLLCRKIEALENVRLLSDSDCDTNINLSSGLTKVAKFKTSGQSGEKNGALRTVIEQLG